LKNCPHRHTPYEVNKDGSPHTPDRSANPPPAPPAEKKEEAKEEKKEEKKESLVQRKLKWDTDFWTPPCDWHLNEDGSDCVPRVKKCKESASPKPKLEECPHRFSPYDKNKDHSEHTSDRAANPPPPPPPEPVKKEAVKEEKKDEAKAEALVEIKDDKKVDKKEDKKGGDKKTEKKN
jgi:hypothetical protein